MSKNKSSVILYESQFEATSGLTVEEIAEVFYHAPKAYLKGEEWAFSSPNAKLAWNFIKQQLDADKKKYAEKCEKNRQRIIARWHDASEKNTNECAVKNEIPTYTNECAVKNEIPTYTNDTDNDNDKDNDKDIKKENIIKEKNLDTTEGGRSNFKPPTPAELEAYGKSKGFIPPTVEEIEKFCDGKTTLIKATSPNEKDIVVPLNKGYALDFYEFYENKGWKIGKEKMRSWQLAFMKWNRENFKRNTGDCYGTKKHSGNRNNGTFNEESGDYGKFDK